MKSVTLTRTQVRTVMGQLEAASDGYKGKDLKRLSRVYDVLEPVESEYMDRVKSLPDAKNGEGKDPDAVEAFLNEYGKETATLEFESTDYGLIQRSLKDMKQIRGNRTVIRELNSIREAFCIDDEE